MGKSAARKYRKSETWGHLPSMRGPAGNAEIRNCASPEGVRLKRES